MFSLVALRINNIKPIYPTEHWNWCLTIAIGIVFSLFEKFHDQKKKNRGNPFISSNVALIFCDASHENLLEYFSNLNKNCKGKRTHVASINPLFTLQSGLHYFCDRECISAIFWLNELEFKVALPAASIRFLRFEMKLFAEMKM